MDTRINESNLVTVEDALTAIMDKAGNRNDFGTMEEAYQLREDFTGARQALANMLDAVAIASIKQRGELVNTPAWMDGKDTTPMLYGLGSITLPDPTNAAAEFAKVKIAAITFIKNH